jgi:predicted RNase H-like HicB family nuclease
MSTLIVADGMEFPELAERTDATQRGYLVVLEQGQTGWGAYLPDIDGVVAAADTEDEVSVLIEEAVEFHIEGLMDANEPVPAPRSHAHWIAV